jgi:fructose-bisphosphate aldolase class II
LAAQQVAQERFEAFGSAGHASKIKAIPIEAMAHQYAQLHHDIAS